MRTEHQKGPGNAGSSTFKSILPVLAILSAICGTAVAVPDDWPQWQGPDRNAISKERGLLQQWPSDGPPLQWAVDGLGGGDSAPSVAGGKIFGMSNRGDDEVVWAISEADGSPIWVTRLGPAYSQRASQAIEGPGCTPTVVGDRLYVMGLGGTVSCLRVSDGKRVWQRNLVNDFGATVPIWSYRESPLVDGRKVICTPGGEAATIVALDTADGSTIWASRIPGNPKAAYASPIAIDLDGQRQYVQFTATALVGVAASDGAYLWSYDRPANGNGINISTPIDLDGMVFAASAYGNGGGLARLSRDDGGKWTAEEVYFTNRMQNHHGGMIVHDGYLYGANGGNSGGYLACLDVMTGEVMWDERRGERRVSKGSVAFADGRIYYRTEEGDMILFEPSASNYVERGRFEQPERSGKPAWAHPVIANGRLYLRDQDTLLCYDLRAK